MSFLARSGLAIVRPKIALALAGDRSVVGRSGSDLLALILITLAATQLRWLVQAGWLGAAVDPVLGVRAAVAVLTDSLTIALAFLLVAAAIIWAAAGPRREVGRSFDLACVAVLPIVYVDLAASVVVIVTGTLPREVMHVVSALAYAWTALLVVLAVGVARQEREAPPAPASAKRAGWGIIAVAVVGVALQVVWLVNHSDRVRPMISGDPAPAFELPRIDAAGAKGPLFSLAQTMGKVTIIDFWATWCGPCLKAMPQLNQLQSRHPGIVVLAISLDDPAEARALFDERGYTMTLLAGDDRISDQYGVGAIPHTVVIDRAGRVVSVLRGGNHDLERVIAPLLR